MAAKSVWDSPVIKFWSGILATVVGAAFLGMAAYLYDAHNTRLDHEHRIADLERGEQEWRDETAETLHRLEAHVLYMKDQLLILRLQSGEDVDLGPPPAAVGSSEDN